MALRLPRGSSRWIFEAKIAGKTQSFATGQTDKKLAAQIVQTKIMPLVENLRTLRKNSPTNSLKLTAVALLETRRISEEISPRQADRAADAFANFSQWAKPGLTIDKIDTAMLLAYAKHRFNPPQSSEDQAPTPASRSTMRKEICFLVRMLRINGFRVDPPKLPAGGRTTPNRAFSEAELEKFLQNCADPDFRRLCQILYAFMARPAEILPSRRSNHKPILKREVDLQRCTALIRSAKLKPGEKPRQTLIRFDRALVPILEEQIAQTTEDYEYLFPETWNLERSLNTVLRRAGIPKIDALGQKLTLHSFRHTALTRLAERSRDPYMVQAAANHKDLRTTQDYMHVSIQAEALPLRRYVKKDVNRKKAEIVEIKKAG